MKKLAALILCIFATGILAAEKNFRATWSGVPADAENTVINWTSGSGGVNHVNEVLPATTTSHQVLINVSNGQTIKYYVNFRSSVGDGPIQKSAVITVTGIPEPPSVAPTNLTIEMLP